MAVNALPQRASSTAFASTRLIRRSAPRPTITKNGSTTRPSPP